jgi:PKD repeat protein
MVGTIAAPSAGRQARIIGGEREAEMTRRAIVTCLVALLAAAGPACKKETVTGPSLSATCEARPSTGLVPLTVSFVLTVAGAEGSFNVAVSYGDGTSGTNPDVPHTYAAGVFAAAFTVTTATQSARCSTTVTAMASTVPSPPPSANLPPHAVFKSTPDAVGSTISGTAPLSVRFNMCASTDPDGDRLYFLMDFDGDGKIDWKGTTGAHCRRDHVYAAGTWKARMCLHDMDANNEPLHNDQCKSYSLVVAP